jgi:hypothetical protein
MKRQNTNSLLTKSSFWQILAILLLFASFLSLLILFLNPLSAQAEQLRTLSVNVRSELQANYSVDAQRSFVPKINLLLVREIMTDNVPEGEVERQYQAFIKNLEVPVPTVTPDPLFVLVNPDTLEPTNSLTLTLTISPTLSVTVTETETETVTPRPTESATPWIVTLTWTPWPTGAPISPTQPKAPVIQPTVTPTPITPTPKQTFTPAPSQTFTLTPILQPTTAVPPTAVPPIPTEIPTETPVTPIVPADPPPVVSTQQPTATPTDEPSGRPTKIPKDTKTPKPTKDKSEVPLVLRVPMLSDPVIIEWSSSQE